MLRFIANQVAAWLQKSAGLKRGDRVALMLPNLLQYPVTLCGVLRAGMVAVNVNPLYTPRELEHQLNDSGAVAIVVLENFAHTVEQVITATPVRTIVTTQVGVPDARSGEAVKVVVVRSDPALTEDELLAHCKQHLTAYKMPRIVEFRTEPLPKTNIGKILRRELRDSAAAPAAQA